MKRLMKSSGLSLAELLVYMGILSILMLGVATSLQYFRTQSAQIQTESQVSLEAQRINSFLRSKLTGGNSVQPATGYTSTNGNYCYVISENKPVEFDSASISNGANFQYRVSATTDPVRNAESRLASSDILGLGGSVQAASIRRSLSMWVKLSDVAGNNRVLFDYSPATGNTGYKMVVKVAGGNSLRVDMGMGLGEFVYNVSNIRNGDWHHVVVTAGDLTQQNSTPSVYVDGTLFTATRSGSFSFTPAALNYQMNIGDSASAAWSLGPVGFWNRTLTSTEVARLGRMESVSVNNAFWLANPRATLSTRTSDVTNIKTVNARRQQGYLLFKRDSTSNGQNFFKIYHIDTAGACPDSGASDNPTSLGFTELSPNTCASPSGTEPLLIGSGSAGQALGFQWRCNLTQNNQVAQASLVSGNSTSSVKKSSEACSLPILASDFATTDSADTAYIIIDNFDANLDLMAFKPNSGENVWPTQMTANTPTSGESVTAVPAVSTGTVSVTWFADAANNVGMMKVVTNPLTTQSKDWWVTNVFKKIIYKSKTDVYASERKIVFALGDAWPIKVCQGLGYKSSYHFYRLQTVNPAMTTLQAYQDAYRNRSYFGMTGYLGNLRCENEKEQVSARVLDAISSNNIGIIGAWATRQSSTDANSSPNFSTGRESINNGNTVNDSWTTSTFVNPSNMYNVPGGTRTRNTEELAEAGRIQWRWIGGPAVDHNVIMLTDHTLCNGATTRSESSKKGCTGMNTITVDYACPSPANNSPACQLQTQSGGNRQFGWWHPAEPNESGSFIWMGYDAGGNANNYWDDAGVNTSITTYLLEFGDHPWDAVRGPSSKYKTAHATSGDTSTNLDPPNVATKTVNTVKAQYCQ